MEVTIKIQLTINGKFYATLTIIFEKLVFENYLFLNGINKMTLVSLSVYW